MDNVIEFPKRPLSGHVEASLTRQINEQARLNAQRVAVIEEKILRCRRIDSATQRQRLAENLGAIIEEAVAKGVSKGDIATAARMSGSTGDSRVFRRYVLSPDLSDQERTRRAAGVLLKRTDGFIKLAKATADRAGWDWHSILLRLVDGTILCAEDADPDQIERDAYLVDLARIIDHAAASIVREANLDDYFRTITDHDLAPNGDDWEVDYLGKEKVPHADLAEETFSTLMGDVVEPRREFIQANALEVANLDV
jgi:hypothetical protein